MVIQLDMNSPAVNKRWMKELNKFPDRDAVYQFYQVCPDEKIDVLGDQKLFEWYNKIVFQFPYY